MLMLSGNKVKELLTLVTNLIKEDGSNVSESTTSLLLKRVSQEGMIKEHENVSICEVGDVLCEKCHVVQSIMGICVSLLA